MKVLICCCFFQCVLLYSSAQSPFLVVLGTTQDGGSPHLGCSKKCCEMLFSSPDPSRKVVSLGIVDPLEKKYWMLEATPNFTTQASWLNELCGFQHHDLPDGIFITHAHIGHYLGLLDLGLEIMNTKDVPIYVMSRMKNFIFKNQPFRQLVDKKNIKIIEIFNKKDVFFQNFKVKPFEVPHRNEFSETVGYKLIINQKSIIFIPDIDCWDQWDSNLINLIKENDLLFLDGTFYDKSEIKNRDISKIPHPEILDTINKLSSLDTNEKKKVYFIHMNHTNQILKPNTPEYNHLKKNKFNISQENQIFKF